MIGRQKKDLPLANEKIRFDKMQVITESGENRGIMSRRDALALAAEAHLDLVLIAEHGGEGYPVVKILDMGKMLYERKKQFGEAKKKQHIVQIKEIQMRPKIADHDFQTKMKQAIRFLQEGKHIKISLEFKGREASMKDEHGGLLFEKVLKVLEEGDFGGKAVLLESDFQSPKLWSRVYALKK